MDRLKETNPYGKHGSGGGERREKGGQQVGAKEKKILWERKRNDKRQDGEGNKLPDAPKKIWGGGGKLESRGK